MGRLVRVLSLSFFSIAICFGVVGCTVKVPNVVGLAQADAGNALTAAHLAVGTVTQDFSPSVAEGVVISQDPAAGASVNSGSTVNIDVSKGPQLPSQFNLTTSVVNGHGTLTPATGPQSAGATVTLTATPDAGYDVKQWTGTANDALTANTNTVVMNADKTVTVEFEAVPGNVTELKATVDEGQIELSWTNPPESSLSGILIQRKTGTFPTSPTDGTTVFDASGETFLDTGLDNGTTYYYTVFAHDKAPTYASGAQTSGTPTVKTARQDVLTTTQDIISQIQGSSLPADAIATLVGDLTLADNAYRGGDICGAQNDLLTFLGDAQSVRKAGGTQQETAEDLYNQARMLRYDILTVPSKAQCPGTERVGLVADATVNAEDVTQVATVTPLGEPTVHSIIIEGHPVFTQLAVPGADAISGQPGAPGVPIFRRLIAVPVDAKGNPAAVTFDTTTDDAESIMMNLYPSQPAAVDATVPPQFQDPPFTQDTQIYATDAFFPQNICTVTDLGTVRGIPLLLLEIAAGQYNPMTGELKLFKSVGVNVHFSGGQGFATQDINNGFDNGTVFAMSSVLNRVSATTILNPGIIHRLFSGAEFLILTAHDFRPAADTLAAWKRTKGITTEIDEVGPGTDFATAASIKSRIKAHYDNDFFRPSYILLLGDTDRIVTNEMTPVIGVGATTTGSDWPYAVLSATPATASAPDFAVGRIPVKTLDEANTVVNKIVKYEHTPPFNGDFYSHATIASDFQCCRSDVSQAGTDERGFIQTSEFARDLLLTKGKTVDRIYTETVDIGGDSTPRRYYDGTLLPAALGGGSGFPWTGSTTDIVNAFNAGRFLFIHRDHGGPDQWVYPYLPYTDASTFTNGDLQSVVFSVNCASGLFDNEQVPGVLGTSSSDSYMAERLLKNAGGGAVGVLGDSRNSPTWANNALLRGYIDAIWPNAIPSFGTSTPKRRLGDILNHGKLYLLTQIGIPSGGGAPSSSEGTEELHLWHCIGDPTLEIWTADPHLLVLSPVITAALAKLVLTVQYQTEGAVLTVFQNNANGGQIVLGRGPVSGGRATINLLRDPIAGQPLLFSANAENAIPININYLLPAVVTAK